MTDLFLQIPPNALERDDNVDTEPGQERGGADARTLQQRRGLCILSA